MLFNELDRIKRNAITSTIVLIFLGNILMFIPEETIPFLSGIFAFILLVVAVVSLFDFISSKKVLMNYIYLVLGLFGGLMGIMFFLFDDLLLYILTGLVSIIPILSGLYGIYHALAFARRSGRKGWWIPLLLSSFLIVFGGFIFYNPWAYSAKAVLQVIGGTLMYSAFVGILQLIWIWPIRQNREEAQR